MSEPTRDVQWKASGVVRLVRRWIPGGFQILDGRLEFRESAPFARRLTLAAVGDVVAVRHEQVLSRVIGTIWFLPVCVVNLRDGSDLRIQVWGKTCVCRAPQEVNPAIVSALDQ